MSTLQIVPKKAHDTCVLCGAPLGAESKDLGFVTCHEHRTCSKCTLPMNAREVQWCYDEILESELEVSKMTLIHPRCAVHNRATMENDPTLSIKQSEYDFLNLIRLMVMPNKELSAVTNENNAMIQSLRLIETMDFEQKLLHVKMMEACVAQLSIALRQDPKFRKNALKEREAAHQKKAKKEAETSTRPAAAKFDDNKEQALAEFMKNFGIDPKLRKVALKLQKLRDKAMESFAVCGLDSTTAKNLADKALKEQIEKGQVSLTEE